MNRLFKIVSTAWKVLRRAPGKSVTIQVETDLGEAREIEYYQLPGFKAGPTEGEMAATVDLGGYRVAVASHNYKIEVDVSAGAVSVYSTNASGDTIQARVDLQPTGEIDLNGDAKRLVTYSELDTALQSLVSALNAHTHTSGGAGAPTTPPVSPMSLDISAAETATVRTGG